MAKDYRISTGNKGVLKLINTTYILSSIDRVR